MIERAGLVLRQDDRRVPLEPVLQVARRQAVDDLRPRDDLARLAGLVVVAGDRSPVAARVDDVEVARVGGDPGRLAAAHVVPVHLGDGAVADAGGDGHRRVVLLPSVDPEREAVVGDDAVDLRRGLIVLGRPRLAAVHGDLGSTVVAENHAPGLVGVNPEVVRVAVADADAGERLTAVDRLEERDVAEVDGVRVLRVGVDPRVVPRALRDAVRTAHQRPLLAAVVAAVEAALLRVLDEGPHARGLRGGDRHGALGDDALGEALRQFLPRVATVDRLVDAAAGPAAVHRPRLAIDLPEGGVEDARVGRIHHEVRRAGLVVDEQHLLPALAAVKGAEDAAVRVRSPHMALRCHVDNVGVPRVDADAGDLLGVLKTDVRPGGAPVGGLVDAVTVRRVAADGRLAHAGDDHVRVRLGDGDRADRGGLQELVGNRFPRAAAVGGLPQPAAGRAEVEDERLATNARDRGDTAAAERADVPELQARELIGK